MIDAFNPRHAIRRIHGSSNRGRLAAKSHHRRLHRDPPLNGSRNPTKKAGPTTKSSELKRFLIASTRPGRFGRGVTFGCVQCHSHPYDPFEHDEYYKIRGVL
ncbi:DUF1549 domain-containing protein [Rhodopirellula europaea]|uniref:DUF1549 domain-containing protein n=1 Tax=Rhodopirellula europaea TaxID=1263866 RepID=UPI003D2C173E